jgi:hypothetical protein
MIFEEDPKGKEDHSNYIIYSKWNVLEEALKGL